MNNDDYKERKYLRDSNFKKNMNSRDVKCKNIEKYVKEQNTFYDPKTNQILYGIDSNIASAGVGNGTCDQVNPLIYTDKYKCGSGTAGGNPCVEDTYNYKYQKLYSERDSGFIFEHFGNLENSITSKVVMVCLLIILLILYFGCVSKEN
jgi:hypothetical protein